MIFLYGQSSSLKDTLGFGTSVPSAVGTTLRIGCQLVPVGTICNVLVGNMSYILKVKLEQIAIERYQKGIQQHQRIRASATSAHQQDFLFFVNVSNASGLQVVP